jgi:hypothetical protein
VDEIIHYEEYLHDVEFLDIDLMYEQERISLYHRAELCPEDLLEGNLGQKGLTLMCKVLLFVPEPLEVGS